MAKKRKTATMELEGVKIISEALPFESAEDLLPEVVQIVGAAFEAIGPAMASGALKSDDDAYKLLPLLPGLAARLGNGRLRALAPKILAGTQVLMDDDEDQAKYDLVSKQDRTDCFDARPDLYLACLFHAGRVTFGPFFSARGLLGKPQEKAKEPPTETPSS